MVMGLILIEGRGVSTEALRSASLGNAKQLVIGRTPEDEYVMHVAAESAEDFSNALLEFVGIAGVVGVKTLVLSSR